MTTVTNLPEMTPSARERAETALECWDNTGDDTLDSHDFYTMEIERAFRDGALAERERIVAMLREPAIEGLAAVALCKRQNTKQCAAICLSHSSLIGLGECPEISAVWLQNALAVLRALADRITAEGKDDNG